MTSPQSDERQASLIDEYGEISRRVASYQSDLTRQKVLKDIICSWFEDCPDEICTVEGQLYRVDVGARSLERKVTRLRAIWRDLGVTKFLNLCTFPLKSLDASGLDANKYVETSRTGPRKVLAILKSAAG